MVLTSFGVVPTRNRPGDLADCVKALSSQVGLVFIIDNGSDSPVRAEDHGPNVRVVTCPDQPPNLSAMWNQGYDLAASYADRPEWFVATVNDDAVVPEGWLDGVIAAMEETGAAAGCTVPLGLIAEPLVHHRPGPVDLRLRLSGWAFVLRGDTGLRADERLAWYFGDDDLDWRARQAGGTVVVPGWPVEHRHPNEQTNARPELVAQTGRDRATFTAKWGGLAPW